MLNLNFLLVHRNRYSEGMDNGKKTPRGHPDFHICVKIQRVFIFQTEVSCFSVTLFYSTLLALSHRQNHRRRNKYTRDAWAGGTFFQLCCCVSFLVAAEIVLGDTYLPYQLRHCVFVLLRREKVFSCTGQFFGCGGK